MVWQGTGQLCPRGSHADLRLSDKRMWIPVQVPAMFTYTEPGVGLTTLLGIGLEDGLILMIPKRD